MPRTARNALVLVIVVMLSVACATRAQPPAETDLPLVTGPVRVPTTFANGRVEITIIQGYTIGVPTSIPITISATRGTIRGPVSARVVASGMGGRGIPSEVTVRQLRVTPVTVKAGEQKSTAVSWDGRDERGVLVPGDAYVLILDVETTNGTQALASASVTFQWNP